MSVWSRFLPRPARASNPDMLRAGAHLREEDILRLLRPPAVPDIKDDRARAHLSRCEACAEETVKLERFLDGLSDDHDVGIGDRVSPERLNRQKHRILRRIRLVVEPGRRGRVLRFPAVGRPTLLRVRLAGKWLGAAAAAGLLLGVIVGQSVHVHPEAPAEVARAPETRPLIGDVPPTAVSRTVLANLPLVMTSTSEDGFLDELDQVLGSPPIIELTPLDEITPRIRETAVYRW